jgi:hypothetical protein
MNLYELTTAKLDQYTKAADADYEKAKAAGDYKKSFKRASGMMKASGKKIDNDVKALQKARGVAEGSLDDIEDTRQFRNAIALAKSQKTIRHAKHGKDTKFYADGTPVTPEETARRAAERKARKQGVAEATEYGIPDSTPGQLPGGAKMTFGEFKKMWPGVILKRPSGGSLAGSVVADVEGWMNNPKSVWEPLEGVAEGMFGIDSKTKGAIQNVVAKLSDIPNMWDHSAQTFTNLGKEELKKVLNFNPKYIDYALNLTADDFEADLEEMDRRGFLKGLGAVAATAAVPSLAQAGSAIDYNKVQMLHDQMFKKNPQYAKEWQAANGERVRAFIKSKDPKFRDRNTARKARLDMTVKILQKYGVKDLNENQFDPINDDDYYEYNVNTKEIVKRISGKHPIASKFNPLQKEWPGRDADHKIVRGLQAKYLKDDVVDEKVSDFIPDPLVNKHSIVKGWRKAKGLDEKAPPGDKAERMVKHIKKGYAKDGKLTDKEKSIAYATAWKAHNAGKV